MYGECAQWIPFAKRTRWVCVLPASPGPATVKVGKRASEPTSERTILILPHPHRTRSSNQGNIPGQTPNATSIQTPPGLRQAFFISPFVKRRIVPSTNQQVTDP